MLFLNRMHAGAELARALEPYRQPRPLIVALPRGGVPVAAEVARRLDASLDVFVVRKIGAPGNPEYAIGAIAESGKPWWRPDAAREGEIDPEKLRQTVEREQQEVKRRAQHYRHGRPPTDVLGRTVIVVDDGLATGATATAAVHALRSLGAARIVVAVPCAAASSAKALRRDADAVVALVESDDFVAVGQWYRDFHQVTDAEVHRLLEGVPE